MPVTWFESLVEDKSGMPPPEPVLLQEERGPVCLLRLNRPEKKNALNDELGWAIVRAIEDASRNDEVRVVGITGSGDAFCSGLDLAPAGDSETSRSGLSPQDQHIDDLGWVGRLLPVMRLECDKPIVMGINGVAVGAGLSLAMCGDMRLASENAALHPGYIRAGTSPDGALSWTLPHLLGHEAAMRFLLDPRMVPAAEAREIGLLGEVVSAEEFSSRFLAFCDGLAALAPIGVRQTKRLAARAELSKDLEDHLRTEMSYVHRGLQSQDGREAVRAIIEKRAPQFSGR